MKQVYTSIILLLTMLFGAMSIAQESQKRYINYQGVARDADGGLMSGEAMTIGIKLNFGSSGATFEETHNITTDANGVFSLAIGNGTVVTGEYNNLPWGEFATTATVSINGSEIGTTELNAVPHALSSADNQWHKMGDDIENKNGGNVFITGSLYASKDLSLADGAVINEFSTDITLGANSDEIVPTQKAIKTYVDSQLGGTSGGADDQTAAEVAYDNSASGLTATTAQDAIDELVGGGAVDADADPTNEIQTLSFDATTNKISLTDGGEITIPSGGTDADADPTNEIQDISLLGTELTITDGATIDLAPIIPPGGTDDQKADEVPYDNSASGLTATDAQAAIDELASGGLVDTDDQALILTGDVLTIEDGAGSIDLSTYKDESDKTTKTGILIGDGTNVSGLIGTADGQVAKWNAGTSTWEAGTDATGGGAGDAPTGLESITEDGRTGWRLIGMNADDHGDIGFSSVDLSFSEGSSTSHGATGQNSIALGKDTEASGAFSTAMGVGTVASERASTAMGFRTKALGKHATSIGKNTTASGENSIAMGVETNADAQSTLAIGRFNVGGGNPANWVGSDPVFEIGNGDGPGVMTANAFTVLKNGRVGIGTPTPNAKLEVMGEIRSSLLTGVGERNVVADADGNLTIGAASGGSSLWTDNGGDIFYSSGKVGVGTNTPESSIAIETDGDQWDLSATEGDFRIGDATHRLKIGVAIDGGGAGDARLRVEGGTNRMMLGGGTNDVLTITDQNVGIGTITPAEKLHVDGKIRSNDLSGGGNVIADADGNLVIGSGGGGSSLWSENGSNIYFNGGKVGIGKDNPTYSLDIATESSVAIYTSSSTADNYIQFDNSTGFVGYSGVYNGDRDMDFGTNGANSNGKVHLVTGADPKLTVIPNGNVGIGTETPSARLDVDGDIKTSGEIHRPTTGNTNMLPIAYGTINTNGSIANGSGNFTVSTGSLPGYYSIEIDGESYNISSHTTNATIVNAAGFLTVYTGTGALTIQTKDIDGVNSQKPFSFVTYKN